MKRLIQLFMIVIMSGLGSCETDGTDMVVKTILPHTDAIGTVKVKEGGTMFVSGQNLGGVDKILLGAFDREGVITSRNDSEVHFTVPTLPDLVEDNPMAVAVKVYDRGGNLLYDRNHYITTNGTSFAAVSATTPANATVGSVVTVTGRALQDVVRITLTDDAGVDETILKADITIAEKNTKATFAIPAGDYSAGVHDNVTVTVHNAENQFDCKEPIQFTIPDIDPVEAQTTPAKPGETITVTGIGLNLLSSVTLGTYTLSFSPDDDGTSMTVTLPQEPAPNDPFVLTADMEAHYGTPDQIVVIDSDFQFDTTPVDNTPVITSIASSNGDDRYFLNNTVTITGEHTDFITGIKVGDLEGAIKTKTQTELTFDMPQDYEFDTATTLDVQMEFGGSFRKIGEAKVYPFFYFKGIQLGVHSNSGGTATSDGETNSIVVLPHGRTYTSLELYGHNAVEPVVPDRFVWNKTPGGGGTKVEPTGAMLSSGKLNPEVITNKADYYSVAPYIFACSNGSNELRINGSGSGGAGNYRYIRRDNGNGYSQWINNNTYGSSPVYFRVMMADSETDGKWRDAVLNGTLETVLEYDGEQATNGDFRNASGSTGTGPGNESSSRWKQGSVVVVQYLTYEFSAGPTSKDDHTYADVYQNGFMHITGLTCVDADYFALSPRSGFITFDLYWPKNAINNL